MIHEDKGESDSRCVFQVYIYLSAFCPICQLEENLNSTNQILSNLVQDCQSIKDMYERLQILKFQVYDCLSWCCQFVNFTGIHTVEPHYNEVGYTCNKTLLRMDFALVMHALCAKILFFTSKYGFLSSIILFLKVTGWQLCSYNKVILLDPDLYISLFFCPDNIMRNRIYNIQGNFHGPKHLVITRFHCISRLIDQIHM